MRYCILVICIFLLPFSGNTQAYYDWANWGAGWMQGVNVITVDPDGNSYIIGDLTGTQDFDPGAGVNNISSNGLNDIFVSKYNPSGVYLWTKKFGGTGVDNGFSITSDEQNNIYCQGVFENSVDFNPSNPGGTLNSSGSSDIFILKLNSDGDFIWAKRIGNSSLEMPRSIIYRNNHIYYCGVFNSSVDFDPGSGNTTLSSSGQDGFVSKLDTAGIFVWAKRIGGSSNDGCGDVSVDGFDNVYITGTFEGTADLNPGPSSFTMTAQGVNDGYILKLNPSGNFEWALQFNSDIYGIGASIANDSDNNVIVGGTFVGNIDFNTANPAYHISSASSSYDCFLIKSDSLGNFNWIKQLTGPNQDEIFDLKTDSDNNVIVSGYFGATFNLDPGISDFTLNNTYNVSFGSFVSKYKGSGNFMWALGQYGDADCQGRGLDLNSSGNIFCSGPFLLNMEYVDTTGTYYLNGGSTFNNCFIVKINDCASSSFAFSAAECDSYTSPSQKYIWTSSGTYNDTLVNSTGCDSLLTIQLTILDYDGSSIDTTVCDHYISPLGQVLYTNGTYYDTLPNPPNCDSIITINLTIISLDTTISLAGATLQSQMGGASYQWLNCENSNPIIGAISQTYSPPLNGNYAVEITFNGCTDTSSCVTVNTVGIDNLHLSDFRIFPNPNNGQFHLLGTNDTEKINVTIIDMDGKIVYEEILFGNEIYNVQPGLSSGLYWIECVSNKTIIRSKIIIQE